MLHRVLKRAGLSKVRFHDLRHTFATLALQNGVDIKTVSGMLGHYRQIFLTAKEVKMGAWGITVRQSDDGLDLLDTIVAEQLRKVNFAAFKLDVYGHVTDQMKRDSADRMQQYIERMKKSG